MGDGMEGVKASWINEGTVTELDGTTYGKNWVRVVADPGIGQPYLTFSLSEELCRSMDLRLGDRVIVSVHVMDSMGLNGLVDNGVYISEPSIE